MSNLNIEAISDRDCYEIAREQIRREDDLVNFRTTWFLAFQALLFAALSQVVSLGDPAKLTGFKQADDVIRVLAIVIAVLGMAAAFGWSAAIGLAQEQIDAVRVWFDKMKIEKDKFPPLRKENKKYSNASAAAYVFMLAWLAILAIILANINAARP